MNRDGKNPRLRTKQALPVKANAMPKKKKKKFNKWHPQESKDGFTVENP